MIAGAFGTLDEGGVLRNRFDDGNDVDFEETHLSQPGDAAGARGVFAFALAGDEQHGNGILIRTDESGKQIGGTGTAGGHADADLTALSRVRFRAHSAGLFVMIAVVAEGPASEGVHEM